MKHPQKPSSIESPPPPTSHSSTLHSLIRHPSYFFPSHPNPFIHPLPFLHFPPLLLLPSFPSFHPLPHLRLLTTHSPPVWSLLYTPLLSPVCFQPHSSTSQSLLVGRTQDRVSLAQHKGHPQRDYWTVWRGRSGMYTAAVQWHWWLLWHTGSACLQCRVT